MKDFFVYNTILNPISVLENDILNTSTRLKLK